MERTPKTYQGYGRHEFQSIVFDNSMPPSWLVPNNTDLDPHQNLSPRVSRRLLGLCVIAVASAACAAPLPLSPSGTSTPSSFQQSLEEWSVRQTAISQQVATDQSRLATIIAAYTPTPTVEPTVTPPPTFGGVMNQVCNGVPPKAGEKDSILPHPFSPDEMGDKPYSLLPITVIVQMMEAIKKNEYIVPYFDNKGYLVRIEVCRKGAGRDGNDEWVVIFSKNAAPTPAPKGRP
jgi:hypothetical protein